MITDPNNARIRIGHFARCEQIAVPPIANMSAVNNRQRNLFAISVVVNDMSNCLAILGRPASAVQKVQPFKPTTDFDAGDLVAINRPMRRRNAPEKTNHAIDAKRNAVIYPTPFRNDLPSSELRTLASMKIVIIS